MTDLVALEAHCSTAVAGTRRPAPRARGRCTESILKCSRSTRTAHHAARGTATATAPDSSGIRDLDKDSGMEMDDVTMFSAACGVLRGMTMSWRRPRCKAWSRRYRRNAALQNAEGGHWQCLQPVLLHSSGIHSGEDVKTVSVCPGCSPGSKLVIGIWIRVPGVTK